MRFFSSAALICSVLFLSFQFGCAGAAGQPAAAASIGGAQLVSISPSAVPVGQGGFSLTVQGDNFSSQSVILLNGAEQKTAYINSQQLAAQIATVPVAQSSNVPVVVKNAQSGGMSNPLFLTVGNPPKITTTTLPAGQAGVSYSAPLSVSGGVAPYRWAMVSGNLPAGLAMNSQTGTISGTATNSGDTTVGVSVTDSVNSSAQASLAINMASSTQAPAPTPVSSSSASSSQHYGPGLGSDGLANTTVGPYGNTVSYRFRAKHSGTVPQVLIYLIPDHPGYAGGTAGTTQVTLNTDDGTSSHNPTSTVLASYVMGNVLSLSSPARYFYTVQFSPAPALAAGQLYHMVFKSIDASPSVNFLSVDTLYQIVFPNPYQPTVSNTDAAVLLSENGSTWQPRAGYTPIYQLQFQNGVTEGIGYMEGWIGAPEPISGSNAVRETFTVSGAEVKVSSVGIRLARLSGNDPLTVRLENGNGTLIEQGTVPAAAIQESNATSPAYVWATYKFSATYALVPGNTYHLDFESSSTSTYQAFPIRKGSNYGFQATTYFPDGHAEFEQNGSWTGWTQWGAANRTDGDLQFYFSVTP
jgi:hypothetical protein